MTPQELFDSAISYYNGTESIPKDLAKAFELFYEAANAGHIESQFYLGRMLHLGEGVETNYEEAIKWYKLAAEQGNAKAQNNLGTMYRTGKGIKQDYAEAVKWYRLAAEQGSAKAQFNLGVMYDTGKGVGQDYAEAVKWYRLAAEQGYAKAQYNLGNMYRTGKGVEQDYAEAVKWYRLAAEQGYVGAQYNLGAMYYYGEGVNQDYAEAIKWYKLAAEHGYAKAQNSLGYMYDHGKGVNQDYSEAIKWYKLAADQGDATAQNNIGTMYYTGEGVNQDYAEAFRWCKLAAEQENSDAQFSIGYMYHCGKGANQDYAEAFRWYKLAAEQGNAYAQHNLGTMYRTSKGVEQNYAEAVKWYTLAAEQGDANAQNDIGVMYYTGEGVNQDYAEAFRWYKLAAEQGDAKAQNNLGWMYKKGEGTIQDYSEAIKWYKLAAEQGDANAQYTLGWMYEKGEGTTQDYSEAIKWYKLAAEQGNAKAQNNLGNMYRTGKGVEQDYAEAIKWYKFAAEQGNATAQYKLGEMYYFGEGVNQDYAEAFRWCKLAAEQGNAYAQHNLGDMYYYGEDVNQDYAEAFRWYKLAAEQENSDAQSSIGYMYHCGKGVNQDYSEAIKWYKLAAEQGYAKSQHLLGTMYYTGEGVNQDYAEAFRWYKLAAEQGYAKAQNNLGYMYDHGKGVNQDYSEAIKWYKLAAEQGNAYAQHNLGTMYRTSKGVEQNYAEAIKWYKFAAEQGYAQAQNNLGVMYADGKGTDINFLRAKEYYQKAIDNDYYYSISHLANLWIAGVGIEKNTQEAHRLHLHCFNIYNYIYSILSLSEIYLFGIGVKKDYRIAVSYLKKIYRAGFDIVCYNLGYAYYHGYGVPQNKEIAHRYWNKVKDIDTDISNALDSGEIPKAFRFLKTKTKAPWYKAEIELMHWEEDSLYIEQRKQKADAGDSDAMFNICRTLARREQRDFVKEELYFNKAIEAGHPQAIYLDSIYRDRGSIEDIDYTTPFYIDEIIGAQYDAPSDDEVYGIIHLIYSIIKDFDAKNPPCELKSTTLYNAYMSLLSDEVQRERLEHISRLCSYKNKALLAEELNEYLLDYLEGDNYSSTLYPGKQILDIVKQHLPEATSESDYDLMGGAVMYSLLQNKAASYNIYVRSQRDYNLLNVAIDLTGRSNIHSYNQMQPSGSQAQTIIAFPEMRKSKTHGFDVTNEQVNILKYILNNGSSYKHAIMLVDREFCSCVHTEMYEARKSLFTKGLLYKVVELPKGSFNDVSSSAALLFINLTSSYSEVNFISEQSSKTISYVDLEANDYCLNSRLYDKAEKVEENYKEYRLVDLIDINQATDLYADNAYRIEDTDLKPSLLYALQSHRPLHKKKDQINIYEGPHILLRYDNGTRLYVHKDESTISCDTNTFAIKVKNDNVETDYLAYVLLDKSVSDYLADITDKNGLFMPRDLLYKRVVIPNDKSIQKQIVEEALIKERQASGSGVEYNIVLVSPKEHMLDDYISDMGVNIFRTITDVNGDDMPFDTLYDKYIEDPSKLMIDAIIVDTNTKDYEDVLLNLNEIRRRNIHMYLLTDQEDFRVGGASKLRNYFNDGNRFFNTSNEDFAKKLFMKMRDDLDSSNAPQAKIRNKYKVVFEAADALDKKYPHLGVAKTIIRYIQTGCNIEDVDNTSGPCGNFRLVCHELLKLLIKKNLVPDIDPGAVPSLILTGYFKDNKTKNTYVLLDQFMDKYLSRGLEYFCKVTNEGVHGSQDSSRMGTAALNILMEFITWFYEKDICSNDLDGYPEEYNWKEISKERREIAGKEYIVKSEGIGKDQYFYADKLYIKEEDNKPLRNGIKIKIKDVNAQGFINKKRLRNKETGEYIYLRTSKYEIV